MKTILALVASVQLTIMPLDLLAQGGVVGVGQPAPFRQFIDVSNPSGGVREDPNVWSRRWSNVFFGRQYSMELVSARFKKAGRWDPSAGKDIPLGLTEAFTVARKWLDEQWPTVSRWKFESANLHFLDGLAHYYVISVVPLYTNEGFDVYIDMAGRVVEPDWKEGKPQITLKIDSL